MGRGMKVPRWAPVEIVAEVRGWKGGACVPSKTPGSRNQSKAGLSPVEGWDQALEKRCGYDPHLVCLDFQAPTRVRRALAAGSRVLWSKGHTGGHLRPAGRTNRRRQCPAVNAVGMVMAR